MPSGIITTSRGKALNIDELIQQAQRPVGTQDAASTRTTGNYKPAPDNTPKTRGFVPAAASVSVPVIEEVEEAAEAETPSQANKRAQSKKTLADHTKVTVKRSAKKPAAKATEAAEADEDDEILGDILKDD